MARPRKDSAPAAPKRDQLVDCASRLFYRDGYHAVGIDTILREAEIAKMTLYHHFRSKEDLIVAALEQRSGEIAAELHAALEKAGASPRRRLLAIFDWYESWFRSPEFRGCAMLRAAGEYPEIGSPVHQAVIRAKQAGRDRLESILRELGVPQPGAVAVQVDMLLQGAISCAHTFGDPEHIRHARNAALVLVGLK
jgi:AcrR family transcriptional regulator